MPKIDQESGSKYYLGVDPGKKGALALISVIGGETEIGLVPMPESVKDLLEWVGDIDPLLEGFAILERVHAMPGQGVTSMFTFGRGYGRLETALIAAEIPFEEVDPRRWQKGLGISPRKTKTESKEQFKGRLRLFAQKLFPRVNVTKDTADAILIAEYCRRYKEGKL